VYLEMRNVSSEDYSTLFGKRIYGFVRGENAHLDGGLRLPEAAPVIFLGLLRNNVQLQNVKIGKTTIHTKA
jgi:hypothetical protein